MELMRLRERGELLRLKARWWRQQAMCPRAEKRQEAAALTVSAVGGMFLVLLAGLALAAACALVEFVAFWKIHAPLCVEPEEREVLYLYILVQSTRCQRSTLMREPETSRVGQ